MTDTKKAIIFIVDDHPANLKVLYRFLTEQELNVHIFENGEQALEQLNHFLPDIILLDVMMPGIDGFSLCRKIKADKRTAAIPIIFLSALDDIQDKITGFEAGGIDYITKPFQKAEVLARLNTQLSLQRAFSEIKELSSNLEQRVQERTLELQANNIQLQHKKREIEKNNIAMRVLLDQHQMARDEIEDHMAARLQKLIFPYIKLLHQDMTNNQQKEYLAIIKAHLDSITEPFTKKLTNPLWHLTPREVLVADLVKQGKTTRQIAKLLKISPRTAERYRNTIRKKLGLTNKKINLHAYLSSAVAAE